MIDTVKVGVGKIVMRSKGSPVENNGVTWVDPSLQRKVDLSTPGGVERFTLSRALFTPPKGGTLRSRMGQLF